MRLRVRRRIVVAGTLAAYAALGTRMQAVAQESGESPDPRKSEQQATPVRRFDIAPGTLDRVLPRYHLVAELRVELGSSPIGALASPGVAGVFTDEQALEALLEGTGVRYRFTAPSQAALELRLRESVVVRGPVQAAPSSPKYTEPLRDVPQTLSIIPRAVIEEQGATTLRDVLQNVPGLTIQAGEGGTPAGDNLTLRGFSARNDIFVDGVRDLGPQSRDPFNLEQVEVAKGPGSVYSGRGSAGGTINLVSKAPSPGSAYAGGIAFGTEATKRLTIDLNQRLGDSTAFRLNGVAHDADVAGRDVVQNRRWGLAPSLSVGLGGPTRLTLSYFHLDQDNVSDYGIPWVPATHNVLAAFRDRPAPVPRDTFYGFLSRDDEKLASDLGTARFERAFSTSLSLRSQLRYGHSTRDSMATPPRFASNDSTTINREMRSWITEDELWDSQTDLSASFKTGSVGHALVAGLVLSDENNKRQTRTAPNSPTTLLHPDPNDTYAGAITLSPISGDVSGRTVAAYVFDTAKLGEHLELAGGIRYDRFDVVGESTVPAPVERLDEMTSGRAGIVYKPRPNASIYGAWGISYNPSLEGLSYAVVNTAIGPEKTRNMELGSKLDLMGERLSLAGSIFRVEKTDARTPGVNPGDPPQVLEGVQRVDGVELGASGSVTSDLKLYAAFTLLDSEIVDSNTPAEVGKELQNTPRHAFSLWATYSVKRQLGLGAGVRYAGKRFGNNTNTREVEPYWVLDGMASYPVGPHLDLRLNLYNLADSYYFERLGGGHLIPGAGRSALLSANVRF